MRRATRPTTPGGVSTLRNHLFKDTYRLLFIICLLLWQPPAAAAAAAVSEALQHHMGRSNSSRDLARTPGGYGENENSLGVGIYQGLKTDDLIESSDNVVKSGGDNDSGDNDDSDVDNVVGDNDENKRVLDKKLQGENQLGSIFSDVYGEVNHIRIPIRIREEEEDDESVNNPTLRRLRVVSNQREISRLSPFINVGISKTNTAVYNRHLGIINPMEDKNNTWSPRRDQSKEATDTTKVTKQTSNSGVGAPKSNSNVYKQKVGTLLLPSLPTSGPNFRSARSPNNITSSKRQGKEMIKPSGCDLSPSCSERADQDVDENDAYIRYPCHCDDDCDRFGDCCHDYSSKNDHRRPHQSGKSGNMGRKKEKYPPLTVTPDSWTCKQLTPTIHRYFAQPEVVYMVNTCPKHTPTTLAARCTGRSLKRDSQQYLMDISVVSAKSDTVYANIFCAQCHKDFQIKEYNVSLKCNDSSTSLRALVNMTYHPGELTWTTKKLVAHKTEGNVRYPKGPSKPETVDVRCLLDIHYEGSIGRKCINNVSNTCSDGWPKDDIYKKCSSYNYYVSVGSKKYKNWHCAKCNMVSEDEIHCLPKYDDLLRYTPPSFMDLFKVAGECEEDQVWNFLYSQCEDVSCGSLFTLVDGKCIRNNKTIDDDQSYLNSSCYTYETKRVNSVMFPNKSVYLNHTGKTYDFGEYEFLNHTWIQVCRPSDRWTPMMNILSTVLISISLVCMLIHMIIFALLPKRRNIPSMNLFSMTLSLFFTELTFVTSFYFNEIYGFCVLVAVILYYFLSAAFMWMNVMSIDICRTFHSKTYKAKSRKIYIQYSIYAWSVPLVATLTALFIDQFAPEFILAPKFGFDRCWFNNKWGMVTFFTFPSGLIVLINLGLYGISVYDIYKQHKSGELASSTVRKNGGKVSKKADEKEKEKFLRPSSSFSTSDSKKKKGSFGSKSDVNTDSPRCTERIRNRIQRRIQANKKQRVRLVLYCKLALMMGLTWIFAFISIHTESMIFEYLFIIFNGLQGTFIFISFDCKKKLWEELWERFSSTKILKGDMDTSSNTKETAFSSSNEGHYRYRWSSNRNQDGSRKLSAVSQGRAEPLLPGNEKYSGV